MSLDQYQEELHHHEQEMARISNVLARVVDGSNPPGTKPDVVYLQAQMIRHRISLALLDAQAAPITRRAA